MKISKLKLANLLSALSTFTICSVIGNTNTLAGNIKINCPALGTPNQGDFCETTINLSYLDNDDLELEVINDDWPKEFFLSPGEMKKIPIPDTVEDDLEGTVDIKDIRQTTRLRNTSELLEESIDEALNDLKFEAIFDDGQGGFELQNIFDFLDERLGSSYRFSIPDLYADTNNDGSIGSGDILYSLVDLTQYVENIPSFEIGETFSIVNGEVTSLPGMLFSSTPFVYDSSLGFTSTPITISAVTGTEHELTTPEPTTLLGLFVFGGVGLLSSRKKLK